MAAFKGNANGFLLAKWAWSDSTKRGANAGHAQNQVYGIRTRPVHDGSLRKLVESESI